MHTHTLVRTANSWSLRLSPPESIDTLGNIRFGP